MTDTEGQPNPNSETSSGPVTVRHDDVAVQVPTTLPPHAVTSKQDAPPRVLDPTDVLVVPLDPVRELDPVFA